MRPGDAAEGERLLRALARYEEASEALPGIACDQARWALVEQLVESDRRNRFIAYLLTADLAAATTDPSSPHFDPLRAAVVHHRAGDFDEACWMVFLFVHFGKHRRAGYRYARDVYGSLGTGRTWDWETVRLRTPEFCTWLNRSTNALKAQSGPRGFGNHRKYEKLSHTGEVVTSYVAWVGPSGRHAFKFESALTNARLDPEQAFDDLFQSMRVVRRFGRVARFDYLTTIGKVELAPIRPGHPYLVGATGPLDGARLLYTGNPSSRDGSARELQERLIELGSVLRVGYDVLEDALCNWQKSPEVFKFFRG